MLALGANAWLAAVGWPAWLLHEVSAVATAVCASTLGAGAYALQRGNHALARWFFACGFPTALALQLALVPEARLERGHGPASVVVAALAITAYVLGVLITCQPKLATATVRSLPLSAAAPEARPRRLLRPVVLALFVVGALAIALVAPLSPAWSEVETKWREAAAPGSTLAAVVGGALAIGVLGSELGSLLRRAETPRAPSRVELQLRVGTLLFVALLGAVVYYAMR